MADATQSNPKDLSQVGAIASISFFLSAVASLIILNFLHSPQLLDVAIYLLPGTGLILGFIALTGAISNLRFLLILPALAGLVLNGGLLLCSYTLWDVGHQPSPRAACMANLKQ